VLQSAGVEVRVDSPNVGERVLEQRAVDIQVRLKHDIGLTQQLNTPPKQAWQGLKYLFTHRGPVATSSYDLMSQFKSSSDLDRPDIQAVITPMALDTGGPNLKVAKHSGILIAAYQMRPATASSIHLGGRLAANAPIIDSHFLEAKGDRSATGPVLGVLRELFATPPLADYVLGEDYPGSAVSTRADALHYVAETGAGIAHAVGACAMGPESDDVVDPRLRVRGVDGLRVVDASVLPTQVAGNTQAPTMAVAWIASDLILEDS
jgi:choline dehydrogenase